MEYGPGNNARQLNEGTRRLLEEHVHPTLKEAGEALLRLGVGVTLDWNLGGPGHADNERHILSLNIGTNRDAGLSVNWPYNSDMLVLYSFVPADGLIKYTKRGGISRMDGGEQFKSSVKSALKNIGHDVNF